MKKLLLTLSISAFALVAQASTTNVGETANISTSSGLQVINFNGGEATNESGNKTSYVSYSASTASSADRYTSSPWNTEINVASGVDAVMNFSGAQVDGFKDEKYAVSPNSHRYHIGGSNYSASSPNANVEVTGASATTSSLVFYGSNFETGGVYGSQADKEKPAADDTITISDITFSFKGTGKFGSNIVTLQNAVFNLDSGTLFSGTKLIKPEGAETTQSTSIVAETIIDNSTYNINTTTSANVGDLGALTFMNGSVLNINAGSVNATTISIDAASSINIKNGATLVFTGANELNKTNVGNVNVETGGTLKATSTNIALVNGENFTLAGGNYELGTFTGSSDGKSNIYVVADSLKIKGAGAITSVRTFFIGVDYNGVTHKTTYVSDNGFQLNSGGKIVLRGGSSLSGDGVNFADTTAYDEKAAWGNSNYIEANTTITANHSRMNGGFIDGKITVNGGYQNNSNWDYTFALGIVSQNANVILGNNVDITVYGNTSNSEVTSGNLQGKLFSMVGNITVNAGSGKIKADDVAGMYIRKPNDGARTVLTLNSTDAFAIGYSDATNKVFNTQAQSTFLLEAGAKAKFVINAINNIGKIAFENNTSNLILDIAKGKSFTLGAVENLASATDKVSIGLDNEVLFGEFLVKMEQDVILDKISFYEVGADGNLTTTQRTLEAGNLYIEKFDEGVYSVYTQAVPEPSQWAVIFGAIALAFVAYRRSR